MNIKIVQMNKKISLKKNKNSSTVCSQYDVDGRMILRR